MKVPFTDTKLRIKDFFNSLKLQNGGRLFLSVFGVVLQFTNIRAERFIRSKFEPNPNTAFDSLSCYFHPHYTMYYVLREYGG